MTTPSPAAGIAVTQPDRNPGSSPSSNPKRRWYREPMMWMVVGLPVTAVVASVATLIIAARSFDGLVTDDYYKQGLEINKRLYRDEAARTLGLKATLQRLGDDPLMRIVVRGENGFEPPATVEVAFTHATRSGIDMVLLAPRHADGSYAFPNPALAPGRWQVTISTPEWRVSESLFIKLSAPKNNAL